MQRYSRAYVKSRRDLGDAHSWNERSLETDTNCPSSHSPLHLLLHKIYFLFIIFVRTLNLILYLLHYLFIILSEQAKHRKNIRVKNKSLESNIVQYPIFISENLVIYKSPQNCYVLHSKRNVLFLFFRQIKLFIITVKILSKYNFTVKGTQLSQCFEMS